MPTSAGSHPFRFVLLLLTRFYRSVRCTVLVLRVRFASLWRSVLAFAHRSRQSRVRWYADDSPVVGSSPPQQPPQNTEGAREEEENGETLAALPVRRPARWQEDISAYQTRIAGHQFRHDSYPATPEGASQRYKSRPPISSSIRPLEIPIGQRTLLNALPELPDGWTRHVHPEGNVLYYHEKLRIFTESDITQSQIENEMLFYATTLIQHALHADGVTMDELTEIVLNVDNDHRWHYYFVDHKNRLLFWVHPVSSWEIGSDLRGVTEYSHIRYLVEAQYWSIVYDVNWRSHCEYYPHNRTLHDGVFDDLGGMLNYARTNIVTIDSSMGLFAQDELAMISDLINTLKDSGKTSNACNVWVIARLMAFFTENQFYNFCGQPCARLTPDTLLFGGQTWNRSLIFRVVNVFLFGLLDDHAIHFRWVRPDGIITQSRWKDLIDNLRGELGQCMLLSTVMLAVDVSFLAVPGVVPNNAPAGLTQIFIYSSLILVLSSIMFSVILSNLYRDQQRTDTTHAAEIMRTLDLKTYGMMRLVITHSLPSACLMWSIMLFFVALAIYIFGPRERATAVVIGIECLIVALSGLVSARVIRLFGGRDVDVDIAETSGDVEQG